MNTFLFGNAKSKSMIVARIGIMIAITVLTQFLCGLTGIQLLIGSVVNMFLILSALLVGIVGGVTVGVITPFIALLIGINSNVVLVPFIAIGNALLVVAYALICKLLKLYTQKSIYASIGILAVGVVVSSAVKYLFMYFVCVKLVFPLFLADKLLEKLSQLWGLIQLLAALIGGAVASSLVYPLKRLRLVGGYSQSQTENEN